MESMITKEIETYTRQSEKLCINCNQLFYLEPSTIEKIGRTKNIENVYLDQDNCDSCEGIHSHGTDSYEDFMKKFSV